MVSDALVSHIQDALKDTNMTPWSIAHTTLHTPEYPFGPISVFTLVSPTAPRAQLYRIRRDKDDPDSSVMHRDYRDDGKARARQRGSWMLRTTKLPERRCPADLWAQVADKNQPVAWTEPDQDNGGFRVLVPHAEAGKDVSYVSALRADVIEIPSSQPRAWKL